MLKIGDSGCRESGIKNEKREREKKLKLGDSGRREKWKGGYM